MKYLSNFSVLLCLVYFSLAHGASDISPGLEIESVRATAYLINNISRVGTARGSIAASPSTVSPNYYYHWVRDGALTMDVVMNLFADSKNAAQREAYKKMLAEYVVFSRQIQYVTTPAYLGEPKFYLDGRAFDGDWSRPQNDGPALRASSLIRYTEMLQLNPSAADQNFISTYLYKAEMPPTTVIKTDLEYVAHRWRDSSYDLWEELKGDHFYTRMAQRRALLDGARIAAAFNDTNAAIFYQGEADAISQDLLAYWDSSKGYLIATRNPPDGLHNKILNLDTAVLLASLHSSRGDHFFDVSTDQILATAAKLDEAFSPIFAINASDPSLGTAIGRYPEDLYNGDVPNTPPTGNPWFLCTLAYAELYYRAAQQFIERGQIEINTTNIPFFRSLNLAPVLALAPGKILLAKTPEFQLVTSTLKSHADSYFATVLAHMNQDTGAMTEQFNRDSGIAQGARDLTWSYASFLSAKRARDHLIHSLESPPAIFF